jgi:hypothetical protein
MAKTPKESVDPEQAVEPAATETKPPAAVQSPTEIRLLEENRVLKQTIDAQAKTIAAQGQEIVAQGQKLDGLSDLRGRMEAIDVRLDELARSNPQGMVATAAVPLTGPEASEAMTSNSAVRFVALAGYPPLGLRQGETFEGRQRFQGTRVIASHVAGGLKIAVAA